MKKIPFLLGKVIVCFQVFLNRFISIIIILYTTIKEIFFYIEKFVDKMSKQLCVKMDNKKDIVKLMLFLEFV